MKYLCLIYSDQSAWASLPEPEWKAVMGDYMTYTQDIKASGHYLGGHALEPTTSATTVRMRNGKLSTTDGPFAETKEQLGGYYLVEAKDLNDAIQVASRIPGAKYGCIEVRPIHPTPGA